MYDGPTQYRDFVERKLNELGVLIGTGDVLYVSIRTFHELSHYEVLYKEFHKSDVVEISQLTNCLTKIFTEFFPDLEKPKIGFMVEIDERIDVKKTQTNKPVEFKYEEKVYSVTIRGKELLLREGFYDFFGKTVYVDKNMNIDEPVFFVEGARMVYKTKDGFAIYKDGKLSLPNGRSFYVEEPFDIVNEMIVGKLTMVKIEGMQISVPIIGRYDQYFLLANGAIAPTDFSWTMKICGPILDWTFNEGRLYVLDIFSYVRAIDSKNRKILWEKRFPRAWGMGSTKNSIYIGVDNEVVALDENGQVVSNENCHDFGIWKEGIITLKSPQEGHVIRSQIGFVVLKENKATLYVDEPRSFEDVSKVRFFDWGVVVITQTGCWVVEK